MIKSYIDVVMLGIILLSTMYYLYKLLAKNKLGCSVGGCSGCKANCPTKVVGFKSIPIKTISSVSIKPLPIKLYSKD